MYSYKVMHDQAPVYLSELCERVEGRTRASTCGDLTVQRTRTKFGERAFIVAGPATWNWLPSTVRNASSVNCFKKALKTLLLANFRSNSLLCFIILFYFFNCYTCTVLVWFIVLICIRCHCISFCVTAP